jgi:hypothetical protein
MTPMFRLAALLCCTPTLLGAAPTTRAADFTEALEQAKANGNDIVVLQRGSDWNRFGETIYKNLWSSPDFEKNLGEGFVLTTVDKQERPGAPAIGSGGDVYGLDRFLRATAPGSPVPEDEIASISAVGGASFKKRADGTWLLDDPKGEHNPVHETFTLNLRANRGGQLVRLDFLPDASLPNACSGRASNGNFALSEVEVINGSQPLKITHVWGSAAEANMPALQLIDGIKDQGGNGWNPGAHTRQPRSLILALASPVSPGTNLKITLIANSQWPQHVPACMRAAVMDDAPFARSLARVTEAQRFAERNKAFTWWDGYRCPRIAIVDSEGRAIAAIDTLRGDLTPAALAKNIRKLRETRIARDELLALAEKAQGTEKAERLRQSLDVLGFASWPGNGNCYKPIHDLIKQLDPQDQSGAVRWLGFPGDPKSGVPWAKPAWNEALDTQGGKKTLTDADYQEAIARVDKELADPRNKILSHENIQRMMVAKFHIYKSWKGHEEERFRIQQEIADLDPNTLWGIGARGYIGMYCKSATPYLTYGWKPNQLKPGLNSWRMTDTGYFIDHPGKYKITLAHGGGATTLKVKRLALLDGATVIAEAKPEADLGPGPNASVVGFLDVSAWKPGRSYVLLAEIEASGQPDNSGKFAIEPWLEEPVAATTTPSIDYFKIRRDLRDKLSTVLSPSRANLDKVLIDEPVRLDLARHELLRRCGTETLEQVAAKPGGSEFLQAFTKDPEWMESFLANDDAKWPLAIENLRFLHYQSKGFSKPPYRTLATAMALAAGEMNRYRLLNRYQDIVQTHQEGLLHVSFDLLDTREMRWAIPLAGTAADYRFMVDTMQTCLSDYIGACWGIPYIDPNVYGYSVQGWGYIDPWTHHYGTGTGDRPFPIHRQVGGVCGTLSGFGATVAKAHGVMSTCVGQPAHCAYVVRIGNEWPTGNDVSGPETNGASVYEGTGFPTMHRLYEPIHADKQAFLKSTRLSWAAHLFLDRRGSMVRLMPGLKYSVYQLPGGNINDIAKLKPASTGTATDFDLAAVIPADPNNFGVVWEGQLEVIGDGPLMVDLKGDDAARITVGGQTVACNLGPQALKIRQGTHPVKLEYGQAGGNLSLSVTWSSPATWSDDWTGAYQQAVAAQPIHYPLVLEYIKALEATPEVPASTWKKLIGEIATAYAPYHEAAWALANRCYKNAAPSMKPEERMNLLLQCHQRIKQENAPKFFGYNLGGVLTAQADSLGDANVAVTFMQKLLAIHFSKDPTKCRVFGDVLNWGRTRFAANTTTATAYAKAIGTFFAAQGNSIGTNQMLAQINAGIRNASESGDVESFRLWTDMAARFLPPVQPGDVHLNTAQAAACPKFTPPSGTLLSKDGMLQTSSACQFDRPLSYRAILDGSAPGWFDTESEAKPWAQVALAGDAEITSIIAVNRYEFTPEQEEFQWAVPFKVMLSTDGKTWTEAATCSKAEAVMRIDLPGKPQRARFVRIERQAPADASTPPGRLHFRNFLVYGRKLY